MLFRSIDPKQRALISADIALMCVIADSAKASLFASASKKELLSIAANFEADGSGKYKFLRNIMLIDHKRLGQHDLRTDRTFVDQDRLDADDHRIDDRI